MPMEQQTMGIAFIVVLVLLFSKKRQSFRMAYAFAIGFIALFTWATSHFLNAISFDVNHPMVSEEISLSLGIAGIL